MTFRSEIVAIVTAALPSMPIDDDANLPFSPPADQRWAQIRFVDGAETQASIGGSSSLARTPLLVYVTLRLPLGTGDGEAGELAETVRNSLRFVHVSDARWIRFEEGPEGVDNSDYRKQVVALFHGSKRV